MKQETKQQIRMSIADFHLPRYNEIPNVGLYLEQTAKFITEYYAPLGDYGLTTSMISNYVKKGLVANPVKKQYDREQIAYLIFVALAKNVLSLDILNQFIQMQKRTYSAEKAYDYFCNELENMIAFVFGQKLTLEDVGVTLQEAKKVIIVPGYGMALSQAQAEVARLATVLEKKGAEVKFAIHPVAGRMPGHMSVLLCEADIDYDKLFMLEDINEDFASCDIVVVIGANDVTNPAANTAEGTPIYGMPVLNVEAAPMAVFCNFDTKPGYAGVPNPLYESENVLLMLGDAKASVDTLLGYVK